MNTEFIVRYGGKVSTKNSSPKEIAPAIYSDVCTLQFKVNCEASFCYDKELVSVGPSTVLKNILKDFNLDAF